MVIHQGQKSISQTHYFINAPHLDLNFKTNHYIQDADENTNTVRKDINRHLKSHWEAEGH